MAYLELRSVIGGWRQVNGNFLFLFIFFGWVWLLGRLVDELD